MDTTLMTELDAVNLCLETIGEQPIANIETSGVADVAIAKRTLQEECRTVQQKGWCFNIENNVKYLPSEDGTILLGQDILRADAEDGVSDVTLRGTRLYDKANRTYVFTESIYLNIITFLPWEDLPSTARTYIAIRAARKFHQKVFGAESISQYAEQDELDALIALQEYEADCGDYNILNGAAALQR